ncbi:MAG: hypothetical protein EBS49_08235, partial [Verrucomicrobia bacterium]|nr:hypothetical protein [Verrucomicrobiota bacterium]
SYGINSGGKQTLLVSLPGTASAPAVFSLNNMRVSIPPNRVLRITLNGENKIEKMDGNPPESVEFTPLTAGAPDNMPAPPRPSSEVAAAASAPADPVVSPVSSPAPGEAPMATGWPGKLLSSPIPENQMEEDQFYARTEFGPRFVSPLSLVSVSGSASNAGLYNQKQVAFSTGYRQDIDVGVWLTDWFGLAFETGFALNAVRGNTQGMTVSSSTFWTVPILAQLCFQYPNDTGWIPYLNFGFGGGWTIFKVGGIDYSTGGVTAPTLSGTGSSVNNAYQIAAGVRYRLYEELSISLAYKFYGNSQANLNLDNGLQMTLGSPVTNSAEVGVNFAF